MNTQRRGITGFAACLGLVSNPADRQAETAAGSSVDRGMSARTWQMSCWIASLWLLLTCLPLGLFAQDVPPTPASNDEPQEKIVERTIYVPFAKLREVFEREGRGVFLPYEQFEALWKAAQEQTRVEPPAGPPVDSIITAVANEATVEKDVMRVSAVLTIELLKEGWNRVPLRLEDAAILSATLDGEAARITAAAGGGYQLLVKNESKVSKRIELSLVYARAFDKSPGKNSVSFSAPQAPVNRWTIRVPQAGVKVNIDPMIAATESPAQAAPERAPSPAPAAPSDADPTADETVLLAFVGAAPRVSIDWTPKAEGATGLEALISVQAQQEYYITEGAVRTRVNLTYDISRSQIAALKIEVPADHKVVNVFDPNVRKWDVQLDGEVQRINVELFEPAAATQRLTVELEKFNDGPQADELTVPTIRALDVGRQQGIVVVQVDPSLRAESTTRNGLLQLDVSELPADLTNRSWTFAFRYAALPFELGISVEKIQPRITVDQLVESYIEPEQITVDVMSIYNVEQAGVFQLEFDVPTGFEVQQVVGKELAGATAVSVDTFQTQGDNAERLVVNLGRKAFGRVGLFIRLQRRITDANLLTPTGVATDYALAVPQAKQEFLSRVIGKLVIYAPESLRLTPTPTGLRPIAISEAFSVIPSSNDGRLADGRAVLAYEFAEQAASLQVAIERRKPYVTAKQRLLVQVEEGVVKYESLIFTQIQYSGVKGLRIDIPTELAAEIRNVSGGLRDTPITPAPEDVDEGYVAWEFTGDSELIGSSTIRLTWETKIDELAVGSSLDINVPRIKPMQTDRAWGQVVITKSESLDVEPTGELVGLRPIDPMQDVMPEARVGNAARAFEFYEDWALQLKATRYELEEVKRTSVERAVVRTVVTRSGIHNVQALYRIRSVRQRLSVELPAGVEFDTQPVRINGVPVALERGDQDLLTIPLVGQDPNTSFVLDMRYNLSGAYQQMDLPEFPEDPAVQKVYLAVYLPEEIALLNSSGPWTDEFDWTWDALRAKPRPFLTDDELVAWVGEDIATTPGPMFQRDGLLYLFSALRPEPPPNGSLQLRTMHETTLSGIVIGGLLLLGLLLLRTAIGSKLTAVTALLIAAVACGVFAPNFGQQLLSLPTIAGLAIVAIGWSAWHVGKTAQQVDWTGALVRRSKSPAAQPEQQSAVDVPASEFKPAAPAESSEESGPASNEGGKNE